jgi:putative tryptophan/tyrosine transport system ATP-binding protein
MLSLKNINKTFSGNFKPVLKGINLTLEQGEFCILIGSNGSGKSTLMKIIGGEILPDNGVIDIKGRVAEVVQDVNKGTIPSMTLLENIALSEISYKKPQLQLYSRYKEKILTAIRSLGIGLEEYIDKNLENLSGGQRQIIATLMAINSGSQILLLDEHTSALDPAMQNLLMEYSAKKISELKLTTLMITHKMDDAIKYGERIIMLNNGEIVFDIRGDEKNNLKPQDLLKLFHKYEDKNLINEGAL